MTSSRAGPRAPTTIARWRAAQLDPELTRGATAHARYLVENGIADGSIVLRDEQGRIKQPPSATPWEEPRKPFFTTEGAKAAIYAIVTTARKLDIGGADYGDQIMAIPFSRMYGILFPQVRELGVGGYCDASRCANVVVFRAGLTKTTFFASIRARWTIGYGIRTKAWCRSRPNRSNRRSSFHRTPRQSI
jgi:hypothetical protein